MQDGRPAVPGSRNRPMISCSVVWSTPVIGSSRRRTDASWTRARARKTRCCWPPERADLGRSVAGHRDPVEGIAHRGGIARARDAQPPDARVAAHHHHLLRAHREAPVDGLALRHVGDPIALLGDRLASSRSPVSGASPGLPSGGCSSPIRSDRSRQRACPGDRKVDFLQHGAGAIPGAHALQDQAAAVPHAAHDTQSRLC